MIFKIFILKIFKNLTIINTFSSANIDKKNCIFICVPDLKLIKKKHIQIRNSCLKSRGVFRNQICSAPLLPPCSRPTYLNHLQFWRRRCCCSSPCPPSSCSRSSRTGRAKLNKDKMCTTQCKIRFGSGMSFHSVPLLSWRSDPDQFFSQVGSGSTPSGSDTLYCSTDEWRLHGIYDQIIIKSLIKIKEEAKLNIIRTETQTDSGT